jgi:predicted PurR-regulated permease PerM
VLALVLTIAVHPLRTYASRFGLPPWAGLLIGVVGVYLLLLLLALALVVAVARFATLLPEYQDEFNDLVQNALDLLRDYGVSSTQINDITKSFDVGQAVSLAGTVLTGLLSLTSNLLFVITLLLFMAIDASHLPDKLAGTRDQRPAVVDALGQFAVGTRRYLVVSTVFGFIVAFLDTVFLAFTPVPEPLLWGLLAFITNYIPNVGFVVGLVPPAILALLEGGPWLMLLVIAVYSVLNFVIQSVIQPKYVGESVGLSGSLTFLSLVFWGWTLGALGALLAVPLSLLAKSMLVDADPESRWLSNLLSGGPAAPDDST